MNICLTPPPEREFPARRLQQRKEQLVSHIDSLSAGRFPHRPRRALVAVVAVATAGILVAATYAGYTLSRPATVPAVQCNETASLDTNTAVVSTNGESPVARCAEVWASAYPGTPLPASFAACVTPGGAAIVFPADPKGDICRRLGLPDLAPTPATGTR
jgi:hypothetical protein